MAINKKSRASRARSKEVEPEIEPEETNSGMEGGDSFEDYFDNYVNEFDSLSPGEYEGEIISAELLTTKAGGEGVKIFIRTEADGKEIDHMVFFNIKSPSGEAAKGIGFLKNALRTLGFENVKYSELEDVLDECAGIEVAFEVKRNKEYLNTTILSTLD